MNTLATFLHSTRRFQWIRRWLTALVAVTALISPAARAQTVTQSFALRDGWNSIWLEVQPTNAEISVVFAGLPVASVWTYVPAGAVEYIQDQSEGLFNQPGWLPYFPEQRPEAFLTKLRTVNALRSYLVKLTNGPAMLNITGRPIVREANWVADSFNLRGFPVNPSLLPSFATFFANSAAHAQMRIYQLGVNGQWAQVNPNAPMKHGEAYWTYCTNASTYQGPLGLALEQGDGLDYGAVLGEVRKTYLNNSSSLRTVCVQDLGANTPLSYQDFISNRLVWVNLPAPRCFPVEASSSLDGVLAMRRKDFAGTNYASIVEIKDDIGTRYLVAVTASKLTAARSGLGQPPPGGTNNLLAGLWVGTASITNVSEANSAQPNLPTPTRSAFDLRMLVHVDGSGKPFFLKEVIQMWQNGTTNEPGRFVLLTDDSLLPQFRGASLRDGVPVGRRISTVDFDFNGGSSNVLAMTGGFGGNNMAQTTIVLTPNAATNPFKHKYHPDHDNLDGEFQPLSAGREEAYAITRQIELAFTTAPPGGQASALDSIEYGYSVLGGLYRETVTGLHRTNIIASGTFRLTRVNNSPVLNQ